MIARPGRELAESAALDAALSWRRHRLFCDACQADLAGCDPGRALYQAHLVAQRSLARPLRVGRTR